MSPERTTSLETKRIDAISFCTGVLSERFKSLPDELLVLNEIELEEKFRPKNFDFMLRKKLWDLVCKAQADGVSRIEPIDLYGGVCTKQNFFFCLKNDYRLAWMLIPIQDHKDIVEEGFYSILKKTRDGIMALEFNEKTAPAILKALQFFADRHLGPMLQKMDINQKTLQMNVDATSTMRDALSSDNLNDKFAELQSKMKDVKQIGVPVDEENNDQS